MNNFFRLNIYLTIKSPDGKDVSMETSRTLPFQPVENLTILLPACDGASEECDPEYPVELGIPTYSYNESAFVESQEDDTVFDLTREGMPCSEAKAQVIRNYEIYGFRKVGH